MQESAFLSLILVQIKVKFQGECIFFFLSLSLQEEILKGILFSFKKKKKITKKDTC